MKPLLSLLAVLLFFPLLTSPHSMAAVKAKCAICAMEFTPTPKASFTSKRAEKEIQFCSFSCAYRFHSSYPKIGLSVTDYLSGQRIDTSQAYFLARSKKILLEVEFDMPPTVVAFATREHAETIQKKLGDGKVILGFDALGKEYN